MRDIRSIPNTDRDPVRMKKTKQQAETAAFTSQLFYFTMNILFSFVLYKYRNALTENWVYVAIYALLLIANAYLILTTGTDPGYETTKTVINNQEQQINGFIENADHFCDLCSCQKKLRTKHCFRCGRCVRKYDHHCPWIGACVGEKNHLQFCMMSLMQTIQASVSFWICFSSMQMYEYKLGTEYSEQFGVFAIFSFFMFLYILFVATLFVFHSYLILTNYTTTQLTKRSSTKYLQGVKGNPFSRGILNNLKLSWNVPAQGHEWVVQTSNEEPRQRSWIQKAWSNQYYDCC